MREPPRAATLRAMLGTHAGTTAGTRGRWNEPVAALAAARPALPAPAACPSAAIVVVGSAANETNVELVREWRRRGLRAALVDAHEARHALRAGDTALARLDVLPTLDGVETGLFELFLLEQRGVRVLNSARTLASLHDKLLTARRLARAGLPHPRSALLRDGAPPFHPPFVLKPRLGSWGRDVFKVRDAAELGRTLAVVRGRPWFTRHGALVQELVPPQGYDLRLIVAGGRVVGAAERVAARGDWRTNVSLGGSLRPADPPGAARALALAAAEAVAGDLVGVDLLPLDDGGHTILELNGAVDFDVRYTLRGQVDLYLDVARALGFAAG